MQNCFHLNQYARARSEIPQPYPPSGWVLIRSDCLGLGKSVRRLIGELASFLPTTNRSQPMISFIYIAPDKKSRNLSNDPNPKRRRSRRFNETRCLRKQSVRVK
jgi:hypothetical protein